MLDWFTVDALSPDTYVISENLHREETHCYLLLGCTQALLIDTGLGVCDLRTVVEPLTPLPIQVVTTHAHWDHIGSHGCFSRIAVHPLEQHWLSGRFPLPLEAVKANLKDENCPFPPAFSWEGFSLYAKGASSLYRDGTCFDLGGRVVEAIHTPGHSPGHCCFFERGRGWLFTGDLIYAGTLDAFYPNTDPTAFYRSVQRVNRLNVTRLFPGHHRLDIDPQRPRQVAAAFDRLAQQGHLCHGSGLFDFNTFRIHL